MAADAEMRDRIIETHTDVKHILRSLAEGRETILDHDKRIRSVEKQLQRNNGKLIVITMLIIGFVTIVINVTM